MNTCILFQHFMYSCFFLYSSYMNFILTFCVYIVFIFLSFPVSPHLLVSFSTFAHVFTSYGSIWVLSLPSFKISLIWPFVAICHGRIWENLSRYLASAHLCQGSMAKTYQPIYILRQLKANILS